MFLKLRKSWQGNFRRSYGPADDRTILEWSPGDVLEVTDEAAIEATRGDIGHSLIEVNGPLTVPEPVTESEEVVATPEPRGKGKLRGKDAG